jgi:AAA family ATP:ADP antiporter
MLRSLVTVERGEWRALGWSFLYFFCLLAGYYVLRPVRDTMAVQSGMGQLPWLFTATFVVMLVAVPVFGWLSARLPRARLLPVVYLAFIAMLLGFYALVGTRAGLTWVAPAFFVWVSVFNLFVVSVFWSFMVDLFSEEQGKRLFGPIAAGGTAGALAGPTLTATLVEPLGTHNLLLVSACFLGIAVCCIARLNVWSRGRNTAARTPPVEAALGGGMFAGITILIRSPYLLAVCFYLLSYTVLSTLLYFEMLRLVGSTYANATERTQLFATLDLIVNLLTLVVQLLITSKAFARLGVTFCLALMPALAVIGFLALGFVPTLATLIVFGVTRRAGEFAISKPAREILFTVLPREQKYKAKNVIDTVVYRCGDVIAGWTNTLLRSLGMGLSAVAFAAVPLATAWLAVAIWLGKREARLRSAPAGE